MEMLFGLSNSYYTVILTLGISACISAMMKMPLTAIIFSLETFGCIDNILFIIIAVVTSYVMTEIFGVKGINDSIVNNIIKTQEDARERKIIDTHVTIKKGSFAEHRHTRDILWPTNFFLLSIAERKCCRLQIDQQGETLLHEGDVLHIRYATFDEFDTQLDLTSIVGEQDHEETEPIEE